MAALRLAVIGGGVIGAMHARAAAAVDDCRLVAICDPDPTRADLAAELDAAYHASLDPVLDEVGADAAIVATPTQTHLAVTRLLAERRIPVLVEKPIASTLEEAREIVALEEKYDVRIGVGHHRRHNPLVDRARAVVREGTLGRFVGVNVMWALNKHDGYFDIDWHTRPGAGPVLTNLIHDIDALRCICGEITSVYARTRSDLRNLAVEDTVSVLLDFESGAVGTILGCDRVASPWAWEVTSGEYTMFPIHAESCYHFLGTSASLAFPQMKLWRYPAGEGGTWFDTLESEQLEGATGTPLERQIANLCAMARGVAEPVVSPRDAARSLACALAVLDSARLDAPVRPDFEGL